MDLNELYDKIDEMKATLVALKECMQCLELKDIEGAMFIPYKLGEKETLCLFLCGDCTDNPDHDLAEANFNELYRATLEEKLKGM